jgi:hypothetical protein
VFPNQPGEFRLKIRKIAASQPRIITVGGDEGDQGIPFLWGDFANNILLARLLLIYVLAVNKESRREAQEVLKPYKTITSNLEKGQDVPVNPDVDIFERWLWYRWGDVRFGKHFV